MSKIFVSLFFLVTFCSCDFRNIKNKPDVIGNPNSAFKDSTTVQMIDSTYNFGKLTAGDKVEYSFRFRNTGKNPLIVTDAIASCGCTVPEKPDAPIDPGKIGIIKVVFNSAGKMGDIHKEVTVRSNAYPAFPKIILTGEVVNKDAQ